MRQQEHRTCMDRERYVSTALIHTCKLLFPLMIEVPQYASAGAQSQCQTGI